jgi:hypothetical protein
MFLIIERDFPVRHKYTCFVSTLQAYNALILMPFLIIREIADLSYNQNKSAVFTYAMPCMYDLSVTN